MFAQELTTGLALIWMCSCLSYGDIAVRSQNSAIGRKRKARCNCVPTSYSSNCLRHTSVLRTVDIAKDSRAPRAPKAPQRRRHQCLCWSHDAPQIQGWNSASMNATPKTPHIHIADCIRVSNFGTLEPNFGCDAKRDVHTLQPSTPYKGDTRP